MTPHSALRDACLRLGSEHELVAGRAWTHIAAHYRGRTHAELLTMAAVANACGADTVRAGLALTHAAAATGYDASALPRLAETVPSPTGGYVADEDSLGHPQPRNHIHPGHHAIADHPNVGRAATLVVGSTPHGGLPLSDGHANPL